VFLSSLFIKGSKINKIQIASELNVYIIWNGPILQYYQHKISFEHKEFD